MLDRTQVAPFTRVQDDVITVEFLRDEGGRATPFCTRLLRLAQRLEGCERRTLLEALRRQERRVRDAGRLAGIAKTLVDGCHFQAPPGAERAAEVRQVLFAARGGLWPPIPGDEPLPYETAALQLQLGVDDVGRLLYADVPGARVLRHAPRIDGRTLLERYNLNLARGVLLDATTVTLQAKGGWRGIFRAVKLARLMYLLERGGRTARSYRLTLTGPAAPFLAKPQRYGVRFARVVPALLRAPAWKLDAEIVRGGRRLRYALRPVDLPLRRRPGRPRYDSRFEQALAAEFAAKLHAERGGWALVREDSPRTAGELLFLPDFTACHRDGREALIEIVGFWTPEYLAEKVRKLRAARVDNLVLVVYRALDTGGGAGDALAEFSDAPIVWFESKPRVGPVMEAVQRVAKQLPS